MKQTPIRFLVLSFLLSLMPAAGIARQEAERQIASFQSSGGYTVLVDAVVTDSKNRVVTGLTVDDFVILEDGVEQSIDSFQLVETPPADAPKSGAAETEPADQTPDPLDGVGRRRNLIVFLLDYATTEFTNQKLVQEASEKYIRENLQPNDYVAVFSLGASFRFVQDFTNDRKLLLAALAGRDAAGNALASNPPAAAPGTTPSESSVEPISVTADSPGGFAAAGQAAQAQGSGQADLMLAQRIQQLYYTMSTFLAKREAQAVLSAIQAIARGVEPIPGRKTLLLFSQGFIVGGDVERELRRAVSSANRANLAIYGIDSQGLATRSLSGNLVPSGELSSISAATGRDRIKASGGESLFDRARQVGSDVRDSALRYVSAATGGFAIRNTNDLHSSLTRVDQDIRSYYLMSYRPSNQDFDGQFRKIEVQVRKKGLSVRARSGYLAVPPGMEILTDDEYRLLREVESGDVDVSLPVYFRVEKFRPGADSQSVALTIEIPGNAIQFNEVKEDDQTRHDTRLSILGLARTADGKVAMRFGSPVSLRAAPPEYEVLRQGSLSFSNFVELEPGIYSFELIVQDLNSGQTGAAGASLMVRPPQANALTLSSIVVGKEVEAAAEQGQGLEFEGTRILPSASRHFQQQDRLVYFLSAYNCERDDSGLPRVQVEISVARSGDAGAASLPSYLLAKAGPNGEVSTSKYIELQGFQPGTYFLTAVVTDLVSGKRAKGRTTFQIVGPAS